MKDDLFFFSFKKHLFHLVKKSPWPFFLSIGLFFFASGLVFYMHRVFFAFFIVLIGLFIIFYVARQWLYDVESEAAAYGSHTYVVKKGLYKGFILFIISEIMLFLGFFWAFFHSALSPSFIYAYFWPYEEAFIVINFLGFPFYNTALLIISGITVTYAHKATALGKHHEVLDSLYITVFLGILFIISQIMSILK